MNKHAVRIEDQFCNKQDEINISMMEQNYFTQKTTIIELKNIIYMSHMKN